jgi:lysophospholipase L1-like esterase
MKRTRFPFVLVVLVYCAGLLACVQVPREKKIEFVYLALGASDTTGVGALPLTEGYVYLIKDELDRRLPGVALLNLGVPGARINLIKEQVRLAVQVGTKADLVTLWTGANDLVHGDGATTFQEDLRFVLQNLRNRVAKVIVVANLPDLTQLPRFRSTPDPAVNLERVSAFNRAIEEESRAVGAPIVDLFAQQVRDDLVFDLDGFHPNDAGHREIARVFLEVILPAVGVNK